MAKVERVSAWQTSDGETFEVKGNAIRHQRKLDLAALLREKGVGAGGEWSPEMFLAFLIDNQTRLIDIFNDTDEI